MLSKMFDNFSFDVRRSPSIDSNNSSATLSTSRSVSPCSPTTPFVAPVYSVTDLSADFGRQRLRQDSQIYSQSCEAYANLDDDAGWSLDESLTVEAAIRRAPSPARRRLQRQSNARLLCSASHHRDIAALLSKMVGAQEQCSVSSAITQSPGEMSEEDCEMAALSRSSTGPSSSRPRNDRRPSDMRKTGTSINKDARLKKDRPRRQRSSDKA